MKIWIGIPAYDGKISVATSRSLISEMVMAPAFGHSLKVTYLPGCSVISHARNNLCQQFLDDPHKPEKMMCIDADVGWAPGSIVKLCTRNKDIVAGIYRYKVEKEGYPMGFFTEKHEVEIDDGLMTAAGIPMGFTAISRYALESLREKTPERAYKFQDMPMHAFFDSPFMGAEGKRPAGVVGEDVAFSFLWRRHGGKIWVDPDIDLIHTDGLKEYGGSLGAYMRARGAEYKNADGTLATNSAAA
jgi:hypothetical protein